MKESDLINIQTRIMMGESISFGYFDENINASDDDLRSGAKDTFLEFQSKTPFPLKYNGLLIRRNGKYPMVKFFISKA